MRRTIRRLAAVVLVALVAFGLTAGGLRLARTPPAPIAHLTATESPEPTAGGASAITAPPVGSLELEDGAGRRLVSMAADQVRAIGSVAKTMTALVLLDAFPLAPGEPGATYTITAADVADYRATIAANGSNLPVSLGEQLTERDLLLGLMLPSANNLADTAARWTAGDLAAFVARLNARAAVLGMAHTHFDDASGFSPGTVSTAEDLVRLGRAALTNPGLADIVSTAKAALPPDGAQYYNL
ncbi:MAG: D-alanyl-D-alanine carboxypeptidase family protein, partial [Candidatus Dormibacteria bacterium]